MREEKTQTPHRQKNKKKQQKIRGPPAPQVSHQFLAADALPPAVGPKNAQKRRIPRNSEPPGSKTQGNNRLSPEKRGKKRAKMKQKIMGA